MELIIRRETLSPSTPTIGTAWINGEHVADSLELPWLENKRRISCIPAGKYALSYRMSEHFGRRMIHIEGVPGRDGILIHIANFPKDLLGCIGLGERASPTTLTKSRDTVMMVTAQLRAALAVNPAWLVVTNPEVAA